MSLAVDSPHAPPSTRRADGIDEPGVGQRELEQDRLAGLEHRVSRRVHEGRALDPDDGAMIDISPGARGNNPLGTNDGTGWPVNPATGQPYPSNLIKRGDYGRILAEFWADGPDSETPPGHWNTLANFVTDHPLVELIQKRCHRAL